MSRSSNTPWRPHQLDRPGGHRWETWPLPRRTGRYLRRQWQKAQRQQARTALARGEQPEPSRPRHSVIYDYW